jgi:hypothetical protein
MRFSFKAALLIAAALLPSCALGAAFQAFRPGGATVVISATTTAASITLPGAGGSLLVYNSCGVIARVDFSGRTATTPTVGVPGSQGVPAATLAVLEIGTFATSVSVKLDSAGPCNVELTRGEGMAH